MNYLFLVQEIIYLTIPIEKDSGGEKRLGNERSEVSIFTNARSRGASLLVKRKCFQIEIIRSNQVNIAALDLWKRSQGGVFIFSYTIGILSI
jgi:hypothetical protein